tara:strand:- start:4450 stop:5211 length:762 start_codon:yes stop_codon:yes gene_type:complete
MMPNIEVITLVYKSVDYLRFIVGQFKNGSCEVEGWDVGFRVIANDATDEVLSELEQIDIPYTIFNSIDPEEFYLNRVYSAYNFSAHSSSYENVCMVNSDMAFGRDWLANLLKHHDGNNIPCSRLVESGKMASGSHGINLGNQHFGRSPKDFDETSWEEFSESVKQDGIVTGGLYMPCVFNTKRFIDAGAFPRGNLFNIDGTIEVGHANNKPFYMSGDAFFFSEILEKKFGMKHITALDSIVYHIQEGEKDSFE